MRKTTNGFTIVELLIVIVIVAILAAITVVAYNGIQERAKFTVMKQDFATIRTALELYKADNGGYPDSQACASTSGYANYESNWCGWGQGKNDSFIPGLAPNYISSTPALDESLPHRNTYLYKSSNQTNGEGTNNGPAQYYELVRYRAMQDGGLSVIERSDDNKLHWKDNGYEGIGWGYMSDEALDMW